MANWIVHILCRNCLLKQVIEGKIKGEVEVTRRRGRRRKKLLDDLKGRRRYCHLKEEALIALCGGIVFEEALDLSSNRILNDDDQQMHNYFTNYHTATCFDTIVSSSDIL